MQEGLFRKSALEKLSTPDQLDRLIVITKPKGWLALLAIGLAIAAGVFWGIFGTISYKVSGTGVLIKTGGLFNICHSSGGKLVDLKVSVGDAVHNGEVIARVNQTEVLTQIAEQKEKLKNLIGQKEKSLSFDTESLKKQKEYINDQIKKLNETIKANKSTLGFLKEKIENQRSLLQKGLITKDTILSTQQQINGIEEGILSSMNELKSLDVKQVDTDKSRSEELFQVNSRISDAADQLKQLQSKFESDSKVTSPYTGRVVNITASIGKTLQPGETIVCIELAGKQIKDLEAIVYVPVTEGKLIHAGMEIQISPTIVKKEEFGFMLGKVISVSEYPATQAQIMDLLGNDQLVSNLTKAGAMIEIYADLITDPSTKSGFKWSTKAGPPMSIQSGTLCETMITHKSERPINLVIPLLRNWTGIY